MTSRLWAPTSPDRIENALDLAGLRPGERFVDLGCGDGRVLLAAARRGADVTGIEIDPARAEQARQLLHRAGVLGRIILGDVATSDFGGDVVFAFLSPATLQRLAPKLSRLAAGTRLVFPEFGVEGWEPDFVYERCFLYHTPPRTVWKESPVGWESAGILAALRAGGTTLIAIRMTHPQGRVTVEALGGLSQVATVCPGFDVVAAPRLVVVDVEWKEKAAGTVAAGRLESPGVGSCRMYGVYTDGPIGVWPLSDDDRCERLEARLTDPTSAPEAILDSARASGPG
jgi:SAM-dependent methyltransferase